MSKIQDGGPAFSGTYSARCDHGRGSVVEFHDKGMSLRDYFAANALAALIGFPDKTDINRGANAVPKLAAWAYEYADAMLAERNKESN